MADGGDIADLYASGVLRHLVQDHQLDDYDDFTAWNIERQSAAYIEWVESAGALYDHLWMDECGRRYGKTAKGLIHDVQEMAQRPGCRGMIATPQQKAIGGIIVPLTKIIFADALEHAPEYFPRYVGSKDSDHQGLYIEATDSFCKLVGLDRHPDATRGQFLDFCHITEAGFVKGLYELVTSVINPQFQKRPHAWLLMESSTARAPDCDFNTFFRADAKLRGAYRRRTIRDNTSLSETEIRKEERRSGGATSAQCRRELYCEEVRDMEAMVVPEFDERIHVVKPEDWPMPQYAMAWEGLDPGTTDPFGLVGLYYDFERQTVVVQFSWMMANASDGEVAAQAHYFERMFWGSDARAQGNPGEKRERREMSIADAISGGSGKVWEAPRDALSYWDENTWSLVANPYARISDIDKRVILNMNVDHGLNVRPADKGPGSADADLSHLRTLFRYRDPVRIVVLKNGHTEDIIAQLRSGMWNTDETGYRTDWERSKTLGHLDCLAGLKYALGDVNRRRDPRKPDLVDARDRAERYIPENLAARARPIQLPNYGGRTSQNTHNPRPTKTFR